MLRLPIVDLILPVWVKDTLTAGSPEPRSTGNADKQLELRKQLAIALEEARCAEQKLAQALKHEKAIRRGVEVGLGVEKKAKEAEIKSRREAEEKLDKVIKRMLQLKIAVLEKEESLAARTIEVCELKSTIRSRGGRVPLGTIENLRSTLVRLPDSKLDFLDLTDLEHNLSNFDGMGARNKL